MNQIINGTAVNGTDFNIAATGEAIIGPNQFVTDLQVPLVNEPHTFGTSTTFTVKITGTTYPIAISTGTRQTRYSAATSRRTARSPI